MNTRFAPAPTGLLHLGHVANAVHVWGLAARLGARVLLRIEDHDTQRSRPALEQALLDDLDWMGFVPGLYPTAAFRAGACASRQSDRLPIYEAAARDLARQGLVYACTCTRRDAASQGSRNGSCAGRCRERDQPLDTGLTWRLRIDPGEETFVDVLRGVQVQRPADTFGDVPIRDRLGNWTYQFAVVVDDKDQSIDLVVRGDDLLDSTGLQMRIARLLGRASPPAFAHHGLIMKSSAQKLSKADGDAGIRALRRAGWSPARVIGHAAAAIGLVQPGTEIAADGVGALFGGVQPASWPGTKSSPVQK